MGRCDENSARLLGNFASRCHMMNEDTMRLTMRLKDKVEDLEEKVAKLEAENAALRKLLEEAGIKCQT